VALSLFSEKREKRNQSPPVFAHADLTARAVGVPRFGVRGRNARSSRFPPWSASGSGAQTRDLEYVLKKENIDSSMGIS
jgi:hypothetical protein